MLKRFKLKVLFSLCALCASVAVAQDGYMSESEAMAKFKEASNMFKDAKGSAPKTADVDFNESGKKTAKATEEFSKKSVMKAGEDLSKYEGEMQIEPVNPYYLIELEKAPIELDVENLSMEGVMAEVIRQVRSSSGQWKVRWRLDDENRYIANERVNLTAETNFAEFINYLVDRVNNMTGVKLFVTVFNSSRIIVISDTYY